MSIFSRRTDRYIDNHPVFRHLNLQLDKCWASDRWKLTLYGEGLNLINHDDPRFIVSGINPVTGQTTVITQQGLPITPTAGVVFEF